jgi:hypothetical protein
MEVGRFIFVVAGKSALAASRRAQSTIDKQDKVAAKAWICAPRHIIHPGN